MNEVVKISIARVSFTLEKGAYKILEDYLKNLERYYSNESGKEEIIGDIEERVAELIIERGGKDRVVTLADINTILDILGKPFESEQSYEAAEGATVDTKPKKTLFRDIDHKVVGGVCSGFSAYSGLDVVWVRLLFVLFFMVLSTPLFALRNMFGLHMGGLSFMILVYVVFWVVIPPARTVAQKCAMRGESPSVDDIQRKFRDGFKDMGNDFKDFGNRESKSEIGYILGRVISIFVGVILITIGFSGVIGGWFFILGLDVFSGIIPVNFIDYVDINGSSSWLKLTALLCYFLPFIGMLYGGIMLCFNFKSPKWKPGLIIFVAWVLSGIAFISLTAIAFKPYYNHEEEVVNVPLVKNYDTLYVNYPRVEGQMRGKMNIEAGRNRLKLFYVNKLSRKNFEVTVYPKLRIYRDGGEGQPRLECQMNYFTGLSLFDGVENIITPQDVVNVKDSLITAKPEVYSKLNKFRGEIQSLNLYVHDSTVVILEEPIKHIFNGEQYYSNSRFDWWY